MTSRRIAAALGVVSLFAASLVLAVLAGDVAKTERALAQGDARFGGVPGRIGMWDAETLLPGGIARRVVGIEDDIAYRTALQRFRLSRPRQPVERFAQLTVRAGADRTLARVARDEPDPRRRSALHTFRGALALEEARLGSDSAPPIRRAVTQFRLAVELDPQNGDALYNLELALRLLAGSGTTSGGGGERAATPASGAGAATSGSGY
ncbi:MAG: hypothetical protein ACR2M2_06450 [Gaiellaceae bacterium]